MILKWFFFLGFIEKIRKTFSAKVSHESNIFKEACSKLQTILTKSMQGLNYFVRSTKFQNNESSLNLN